MHQRLYLCILYIFILCQPIKATLLEIFNDTHGSVFISDHQTQATIVAPQESITLQSLQKTPFFFYTQHNTNTTFQLICGLTHTIQHQEKTTTDNHEHKVTVMISQIFSATILFAYPGQFIMTNQTEIARLTAKIFQSKESITHPQKNSQPTPCPTTDHETQNFLQSIKNQQQQIKNSYTGKEQSISHQEIMAHNIASFAATRQHNVHQFMRSSRR